MMKKTGCRRSATILTIVVALGCSTAPRQTRRGGTGVPDASLGGDLVAETDWNTFNTPRLPFQGQFTSTDRQYAVEEGEASGAGGSHSPLPLPDSAYPVPSTGGPIPAMTPSLQTGSSRKKVKKVSR